MAEQGFNNLVFYLFIILSISTVARSDPDCVYKVYVRTGSVVEPPPPVLSVFVVSGRREPVVPSFFRSPGCRFSLSRFLPPEVLSP